MKKINIITVIICTLCITSSLKSYAQIDVFGSGYFQNQYLFNPAMSGLNSKELNINTAYMGENNSIKNSPKSIYVTGDYAFNDAVGVGLSVVNDRAGLLNLTRIAGTYSYHIRLGDEDQKMSFGLTAIGIKQNLSTIDNTGNPDDPSLYNLNDRKIQFESDFGAAYTDGKFTGQAAIPNIISFVGNKQRNAFNQATIFAAASYKFKASDDEGAMTIEPKVAYRGFKDIKSVVDAGVNVVLLQDVFNVYGLYHTTKYATFGMGVKLLDAIQLSAAYHSTSSGLSNASLGGKFELGLRFTFASK